MMDSGDALPAYEEAELCNPAFTDEYINRVRKRLNEDADARADREKRRRKVFIEQLMSHEAQEVNIDHNKVTRSTRSEY